MTRWQPMVGGLVVAASLVSGPGLAAGETDAALVSTAEEVSPALVGTTVPDGTVRTEDGQETTLGELRDGRPVILVFYRGHWWPHCKRQLVQLQRVAPQLGELGYRLIAISPDAPEKNAELAQDLGLDFPVVGDEGLVLSRRFGIVFQAPDRAPLPVPAVYMVDGPGTIQLHYVHPDYKIRLDPELLLAAARLGQPGKRPE